MNRVDYEVLPMGSEWMVRMAANSHWEIHPTQAEAVRRARELGRRHAQWSVRVLGADGALEAEYTSDAGHP
jgi:hypothetical protein